ncbi:ligase-associated DNA damage response endonuclease PdeM [Xanthobacter pseudotagetidis]|uniref:ligase-associated DNA damage response endonuclease PdeM n=1 Tax=Xanthobacter pseudotagetidis TaxID=3119911 RepID=UPI00372B5B31
MLARAESSPVTAGPASEAICGREALLDPSGALFLVEERALVVADMHLEKGSAFARRGQMLPPYDTAETLARLAALVARLKPRLVVALGDSLHDRWGAERLGTEARAALAALQAGRDFLWIAGNHDPEPHGLGGACAPCLDLGGLVLRHEPGVGSRGGPGEICGHLHPVARVVRRGRALRRRCFVTDGARMVLPAFGAYAGGLEVSAPAIAGLFGPGGFTAHLLGEGRTYRLTSDACF